MNTQNTLPQEPFQFVLYFMKRQKLLIMCVVILVFSVNTGIPLALYFIGELIDVVSAHDLKRDEIWSVAYPYILTITLLYVFLDAIPSRLRYYLSAFLNRNISFNVQTAMGDYLLNHSLFYFYNDFSGRLAMKATEASNNLVRVLRVALDDGLHAFFIVCSTVFLFFTVHWSFGVFIIIWAVIFILFTIWTVPKTHHLAQCLSEERSQLNGKLVDTISNIYSALSFANLSLEKKRYKIQVDKLKDITFQHAIFIAHTSVFKEVMWQMLFSPMVIFMIWQWQNDVITVGNMAMMIPLLLMIAKNAWSLSDSLVEAFSEYGMLGDAVKTIIVPHAQNEGSHILNIPKTPSILFKDVVFQHEQTDGKDILFDKFSLDIPAGQKIGLLGASGMGKSTLVNLLLQFYDIQGGQILIDGQNIIDVTQESLRQNIAIIPQDTSLFHRNLMENIRYGCLEASDEEVIVAAQKAHIHDFIESLPHGYETLVGERGVKLSGGQRQRIAIARAILKDAPILILDEATSALDSNTENLIQESLKELMRDKTVIAIAHRLSTIASLDRLIVMNKGTIAEDGTHNALMAKKGLYAKLWAIQAGGFIS